MRYSSGSISSLVTLELLARLPGYSSSFITTDVPSLDDLSSEWDMKHVSNLHVYYNVALSGALDILACSFWQVK